MTTTATKTTYQHFLDGIESVRSKSSEEMRKIQTYADGWRQTKDQTCLSPSHLWQDLKDMGLRVDITVAIVLHDGGTQSLREYWVNGSEFMPLGASMKEIDAALLDLNDAALC